MNRKFKIILFLFLMIDLAIIFLLFNSRSFSHLAIWNIEESLSQKDFNWFKETPAPKSYVIPDKEKLSYFNQEANKINLKNKNELEAVLFLSGRLIGALNVNYQTKKYVTWDHPQSMDRYIQDGHGANCIYRSIVLSSYLSSMGIYSRLWSLENIFFEDIPHTVIEVYAKHLEKWVFLDVMHDFMVLKDGIPLSLLEFRSLVLSESDADIKIIRISTRKEMDKDFLDGYRHLLNTVFLRLDNDFIKGFEKRYGILNIFSLSIDRLSDKFRRGIDYIFGSKEYFIHFVDRYSPSLSSGILFSKSVYLFFVFSFLLFFIICFVYLMKRRKR
ncbi:MAG: hypothetical protein P9L96_03155 [Candidatus Gygaella obscura]|nr:hypothetical protein [Candidatus Gygaella obscura]